jgi:predicted O-methyltransferase YrrM
VSVHERAWPRSRTAYEPDGRYDLHMDIRSLWPPRHGARRLAQSLRHRRAKLGAEHYQRRHGGVPWTPQSAVEILSDMLRTTDRCLEWGSGASTTWFADRTASIVSIEHDPDWFERVRTQLAAHGADVEWVRLLAVEPQGTPTESPYVRVIDEFPDEELDVCFIDGEHRAACALESIPKLSSGGLLIVDDAQHFIDHPSRCQRSRDGQGPSDAEWARFTELVRNWRLIWTGDGFSDTAIWIKP